MIGGRAMMADAWTICRYETVGSTQSVASDLIANGARHRTVVVAERQTAGYGRKGDRWHDNVGDSLLMTLILRPAAPFAVTHYAMIAALAVIAAIVETTGLRAGVKWPNDLLLNNRKVAGILGDATWQGGVLDAVRIGVGINVCGDRASLAARGLPGATSIAAEIGEPVERDAVVDAFLRAFATFEDAACGNRAAIIVAAWRDAVVTRGRRVHAHLMNDETVVGTATNVTDDGDLIVTLDSGAERRLSAPAVRSLRHRDDDRAHHG